MSYRIRSSQKDDIPFLWEMLYQSIFVAEGESLPSRDILKDPSIEKYLKDWGKQDDHAFIAIDVNEQPVGAIWIRRWTKNSGGYGFIDEQTPELGMAIISQFRGKGIGGALLQEMISTASLLNFKALSLSVDPRNLPALRLYEKNGFVKVMIDTGGSWTMKKVL